MRLPRQRVAQELIHQEAGRSFRTAHYRCRGFRFSPHQHPEFELTLMVRGSGRRWIGHCSEPFANLDLILVGPNLLHTWHCPQPAPSEVLCVQFDRFWAGAGWLDHPEVRPLGSLLHRASAGLVFTHETANALLDPFIRLTDMPAGPARVAQLHVLLAGLHAASSRMILAETVLPSKADADWPLFLEDLRRRCRDPLSQRGLAARLGMSPSAFAHAFARHTGLPFSTYLAELRLDLACRTLLATGGDLTGAALAAGFPSSLSFTRWCKLRRGCTPSVWLRLHGPPT